MKFWFGYQKHWFSTDEPKSFTQHNSTLPNQCFWYPCHFYLSCAKKSAFSRLRHPGALKAYPWYLCWFSSRKTSVLRHYTIPYAHRPQTLLRAFVALQWKCINGRASKSCCMLRTWAWFAMLTCQKFNSSVSFEGKPMRTRMRHFLDAVGSGCCYRRQPFHTEFFSLWL